MIGIPMLKIRRSNDIFTFNMVISYLGKTVFMLKRGAACHPINRQQGDMPGY